MIKTVLCFGDSNTWGHDPESSYRFPGLNERYPEDIRWTGVLGRELGRDYRVIEEGLCGRTTVWDDPVESLPSGLGYLGPCLQSHRPLAAVVIMLGTNDLKPRFGVSAFDIAEAVGRLGEVVRASGSGPEGRAPALLIACPPPIAETGVYAELFRGGAEKSKALRGEFERMGRQRGFPVAYIDEAASSSPLDGIHFSVSAHAAIGAFLAERLRALTAGA
jgi:lysophospholipase L1-like esterase